MIKKLKRLFYHTLIWGTASTGIVSLFHNDESTGLLDTFYHIALPVEIIVWAVVLMFIGYNEVDKWSSK